MPTQVIRSNAPKTMKPAIKPIFDSQTRYKKVKNASPSTPIYINHRKEKKGKLIDMKCIISIACYILLVSVKLPEDQV